MKKILEKIDIDAKHLKEILTILKMRAPDSTVIAFGSRVEFTAKPNSDLDLAIICDKKTAQKAIPRIVDDFQESDIPFNIDILDYNRLPDNIKKNIDKEFVEIYHPEQKKIPAGWKETTFDQAVLLNPTTKLVKGQEYPFVDMKAIEPTRRNVAESESRVFKSGGSRFMPHDTLMARITPCLENGKIARYVPVSDECSPAFGSTEFIVIRGKDGVTDNNYAYYLTRWQEFRNFAIFQMTGSSGRQRVPVDSLIKFKLKIPSEINEQKAIAHILGSLDDKIELNRQMNRTLEAMAQAIFKSWFMDFDPVMAKSEDRDTGLPAEIADLFPYSFEESELGLIPKGWRIQAISDLTDIVGGSTPRTTELNYWQDGIHFWATPKDLSALSVPLLLETERRITDAGLAQISSGLLPVGTVLLSSRAPIGYLAIAEIPVAINQGFIAMKPKKDISNLFVLFWTSFAHDEILSRANGSTFLEISKTNFRPIPLVVPSDNVMRTFDKMVRVFYERIVTNEHEIQNLSTLRDTILPKLIFGELRVPDAKKLVGGVK